MVGGRRPLVEDTLRWKITSLEDNLWWKTSFGGRQPSVEDDFRWKTPYSGRRPTAEDNLWWKMTFVGRKLLVEDGPCMLPSPLCGSYKTRLGLVEKEAEFLQKFGIRPNFKNLFVPYTGSNNNSSYGHSRDHTVSYNHGLFLYT